MIEELMGIAQPYVVLLVYATWWLRVPAQGNPRIRSSSVWRSSSVHSQESRLISSPAVGGEETWSLLLKLDLGRINYIYIESEGQQGSNQGQQAQCDCSPGATAELGRKLSLAYPHLHGCFSIWAHAKDSSEPDVKIWDIISWKETLTFHHRPRILHAPELFFRILISQWLPCTCLDPLMWIAISWARALGSKIYILGNWHHHCHEFWKKLLLLLFPFWGDGYTTFLWERLLGDRFQKNKYS